MAKFTPGPWAVTGQSETGKYIIVKAVKWRTVARVPWSTEKEADSGRATDHSDSLLIAAAPSMYEALQQMLRATDTLWQGITPEQEDRLATARMKAKGAIGYAEGK